MALKQAIIRTGLEALYFSGSHLWLRPFVGGVGVILTLHHVRPARRDGFQPNRLQGQGDRKRMLAHLYQGPAALDGMGDNRLQIHPFLSQVELPPGDPRYLQQPFIVSSQFKKESDGSKWDPKPCSAKW